jgi:RNA methyltransferase, TrmH family
MRLLTLARDLRRRKARERQGLFTSEGVRVVEELLRSPLEIVGVLTAPQLHEAPRGEALLAAIGARGIAHSEVKELEFRSAAETESPQGVIAMAKIPDRSFETLRGRHALRVVVLDAVQDPGNVGTIVRTAAALGADATVALPGTVDLWNPKVVRSAVGAHFHHHAFHGSWEVLQSFVRDEGVALWGSDSEGEGVSAPAPARLAIALGNEGSGLTEPVRRAATRILALPISSMVESLNVAVAAGILLYELRP